MTPIGAGLAISFSLGASALGVGLIADAITNAATQVPVVQWPQLTGTAGIVAMLGYAVNYLVKRNEKLEALLEKKNEDIAVRTAEWARSTAQLTAATDALKLQSQHQCDRIQGLLVTQRRFMDVLGAKHGFKITDEFEDPKYNDPSKRKPGV